MVLDANGNRISGPTDLLEYISTGRSTVVALAAGPDGLYFSELYEETGASGPTATGARIFRVRYVNPIVGDYDIDGNVDNDDHAVWRTNFGSNLLLAADGNKNGVVDTADYIVWRNAMSAGAAASASVAADGEVPETVVSVVMEEVSLTPAAIPPRASASTVAIDTAMEAFRRPADAGSGTRHGTLGRSFTAAHKHDNAALLIALQTSKREIERPSNTSVGLPHSSDESSNLLVVDNLISRLTFRRVRR